MTTTTLAVHRTGFRCTELENDMLKDRPEGPDQVSGQQQTPVSVVQNKDDKGDFDEIFLPYLPEAYRLAQWLSGNASDAEDIVQEAAIRAFRGIKGFGAVNARAWSLTIVRNTALSWLTKNRPRSGYLYQRPQPGGATGTRIRRAARREDRDTGRGRTFQGGCGCAPEGPGAIAHAVS